MVVPDRLEEPAKRAVLLGADGTTVFLLDLECKSSARVAPETATNVRPLNPNLGRARRVSPRSPQSLCHSRNAATGRDKSLTLQRPQARPARLLPRCGTGTRAVSRLQRFSSHQATACSHDSARWCWSASVKVTKRPALPAHPNSESPLSLAQNCQGQQRLFGAKAYSRKGREPGAAPETRGKQSANCGRCPGGDFEHPRSGEKATLTKHPPAQSTLLPMVLRSGSGFAESAHSGKYGALFTRSPPAISARRPAGTRPCGASPRRPRPNDLKSPP